jgi:hypothetical protein
MARTYIRLFFCGCAFFRPKILPKIPLLNEQNVKKLSASTFTYEKPVLLTECRARNLENAQNKQNKRRGKEV